METIKFTVKLPPISKKNSQQILTNSRTGKPFIMPSKKFKQYEKDALWFIPKRDKPIDYPVNVKCLFYMPTRRKCDLTNMLEAIDDVMVKAGLLADDNYSIIVSHDGSRCSYDKENSRTEIEITPIEFNKSNYCAACGEEIPEGDHICNRCKSIIEREKEQ